MRVQQDIKVNIHPDRDEHPNIPLHIDDNALIQLDIPPLREDNTNFQEVERIKINEQTRTGRDWAYYVQLFFDFVRANMGPT